jgi:hypothetical protein
MGLDVLTIVYDVRVIKQQQLIELWIRWMRVKNRKSRRAEVGYFAKQFGFSGNI